MAGPVYTYTLCTPDAASPMNQTTTLIRANFQAINELVDVNHVGFNDVSNYGKHNIVSCINITDPITESNEIDMYSKVTGSPNPCELFIRYPNSGDIVQISIPTPPSPLGTSSGNASSGYASFNSGIILRWGTYNYSSSANSNLISWSTGPNYKFTQISSCASPIGTGVKLPNDIIIYEGRGNGQGQDTPVTIASIAQGVHVTINYLLIGQ